MARVSPRLLLSRILPALSPQGFERRALAERLRADIATKLEHCADEGMG
jgi:hypothetical protein